MRWPGIKYTYHNYCHKCGAPMAWMETGYYIRAFTDLVIEFDRETGAKLQSGYEVFTCTASPLTLLHDTIWGSQFRRPYGSEPFAGSTVRAR